MAGVEKESDSVVKYFDTVLITQAPIQIKDSTTIEPPTNSNTNPDPQAPPKKPKAKKHGQLLSTRGNRLSFNEKKVDILRHPTYIKRLYEFHCFLFDKLNEHPNNKPLVTKLPLDKVDLIAMLIQDRDLSLTALTHEVQKQICPAYYIDDEETKPDGKYHYWISKAAIQDAILETAYRVNYGVPLTVLAKEFEDKWPSNGVPPQSICIWKWEMRDPHHLPSDVLPVYQKKSAQKLQVREYAISWFSSNSDAEKQKVLDEAIKQSALSTLKPEISSTNDKKVDENTLHSGPPNADTAISSNQKSKEPKTPKISSRSKEPEIDKGQLGLQRFFTVTKESPRAPSTTPILKDALLTNSQTFYAQLFRPFHIKRNAMLSKLCQPRKSSRESIDRAVESTDDFEKALIDTEFKTWIQNVSRVNRDNSKQVEDDDSDAMSVYSYIEEIDEADGLLSKLRSLSMKLIHFHDNRRPDYWGTWSKEVKSVNGRRPFAKDTDVFDYDFNSDAEWEVDEEGEELVSEEEDDDDDDEVVEEEEGIDDDDGFLVDENDESSNKRFSILGMDSDDDDDNEDDGDFGDDDLMEIDSSSEDTYEVSDGEDETNIKPEEEVNDSNLTRMEKEARNAAVKSRLRPKEKIKSSAALMQENEQRKRRRRIVKPLILKLIGPVWPHNEAESTSDDITFLKTLPVVNLGDPFPIDVNDVGTNLQSINGNNVDNENAKTHGQNGVPGSPARLVARKKQIMTESDIFILAQVVHGSILGISKLIMILKVKFPNMTKQYLEAAIRSNSIKEKRPGYTRSAWFVNQEIIDKALENSIEIKVPEELKEPVPKEESANHPDSPMDEGKENRPTSPPPPPKMYTLDAMFMKQRQSKREGERE
ncbi:hypothetical protein H4219_002762 [Mycoemilia scoparia]|uniref:Uncharacterized protein n=1 Tax=Mycoemilia scoparia TaxID=417184 RepID=A0A9W8DUC9_9FUNG|nr:hypothetical protein H4219_002762 [Mycoemilia scoparia]